MTPSPLVVKLVRELRMPLCRPIMPAMRLRVGYEFILQIACIYWLTIDKGAERETRMETGEVGWWERRWVGEATCHFDRHALTFSHCGRVSMAYRKRRALPLLARFD